MYVYTLFGYICILKRQRVVKVFNIHFSKMIKMWVALFEGLYLGNHTSDRLQTSPVSRDSSHTSKFLTTRTGFPTPLSTNQRSARDISGTIRRFWSKLMSNIGFSESGSLNLTSDLSSGPPVGPWTTRDAGSARSKL